MGSVEAAKPHAVCIPHPTQGHINPMLNLAKLLHFRGFYITFVNTEYNQQRLLKSRGPEAMKGLDDFRFETIPDGLPLSDPEAPQDLLALSESVPKNCLAPFRNLIGKLNGYSPNVPPVTCIVADGVMSFTLTVGEELGLPVVFFWMNCGHGFMALYHLQELMQRGLVPFKDVSQLTDGYLDNPIDWIPGMKDICLKDLPGFIRTTDPNDFLLNLVNEEAQRAFKASAIVFNTFDDLEQEVLDAIKGKFPRIYTMGPLPLLCKHVLDNRLNAIGGSLWKEDTDCLEWLDRKEPRSVLYVNFGSITVLTVQQLIEFAWGLANSKHPFLWVIRPDLVVGDSAILPKEFIEGIAETGILPSWCPQEKVLSHPSVGGFLTHSGWNSTVESICGGVPMICWPFFADQHTNCHYTCKDWGIGLEISKNVKREEIVSLVRELMEGTKGKEMKKRATEWKIRAEEATKEGGSSYMNMDKLVHEVLICREEK